MNLTKKQKILATVGALIILLGIVWFKSTEWKRVFTVREVDTHVGLQSYTAFEITNNTNNTYKDVYLVVDTSRGTKEYIVARTMNPHKTTEYKVNDLSCKVKKVKFK